MKRLRRINDSSSVSFAARMFEVDIFVGDVLKSVKLKEIDGWFFGPQGGAYSPARRALCVAKDQDYRDKDDARVLHELAHLVCAVPFFSHARLPEELFLLQWETELAKAAKINWDHYTFYRGSTKIPSAGLRRLREVKSFETKIWWEDGLQRAIRLGILTAWGREITWRWPNWDVLDRDVLLKWRKRGFG